MEIFLEIYFFLKKWYSIDILQLPNVYVKNWYIYLKYREKKFDPWKP